MKIRILILILVINASTFAQTLKIAAIQTNSTISRELNEKFNDVKIVELDINDFRNSIQEEKISDLILPGALLQSVKYVEANLLSPDYKATISSENGREFIRLSMNCNYIVYDADTEKHLGRLNIGKNKLNALFFMDNKSYYLRPLNELTSKNVDAKLYVLYQSKDILSEVEGELCGIHKNHFDAKINEVNAEKNVLNACYVIEVATESDYQLYQKYSNDAQETLQRVVDQFNLVEGIYLNSGIDLSFALVYQNVWTTIADPYIEGERFAMRAEFRTVWNNAANGFTDIDRDVAYMVSGKVGTGGGAAYISTAGDPTNAYAVGQEFDSDTDQHLIAHEIGHTLSASHNTGTECTSGNKPISGTMCPFVGTMGFTSSSVTEISDYLDANSVDFTQNENLNVLIGGMITDIRSYVVTSDLTLRAHIINPGYLRAIAGKSITLPPFFRAQSGCYFQAKINPNLDSCN